MILGKYFKVPADNKRYTIDYFDWLDLGETVAGATFTVLPADSSPVVISGNVVNTAATGVILYAGGGNPLTTYIVYVTMLTSGGQTREDTIQFTVKAA
jgi:hypothetical protein